MADVSAWIADLLGWVMGRAIGKTFIWVLFGGPVFLLVMLLGFSRSKTVTGDKDD